MYLCFTFMATTFLKAKWENLIMANYSIDPKILLPFLPAGLELDTYNGKTFVSLVGFLFRDSKIFNIPIPFMGTFEEVNLRFYVKRKTSEGYRRGVVFISETVPYKPVAWLANKLYKEHYIAIPTKHHLDVNTDIKTIKYEWKVNENWNSILVKSKIESRQMQQGSLEEFIFEHYYGYTKLSDEESQEYRVNHPRWMVHDVIEETIQCDFSQMYGHSFGSLNHQMPDSVIIAEGSEISVDWKRIKFNCNF